MTIVVETVQQVGMVTGVETESLHPHPYAVGRDIQTEPSMCLGNLKALPLWHIVSEKSTHPNSSLKTPPIRDQTFKFISVWGGAPSFKPPEFPS